MNIYIDVDVPDAIRKELLPLAPVGAPSIEIRESVVGELYRGARELLDRHTAIKLNGWDC